MLKIKWLSQYAKVSLCILLLIKGINTLSMKCVNKSGKKYVDDISLYNEVERQEFLNELLNYQISKIINNNNLNPQEQIMLIAKSIMSLRMSDKGLCDLFENAHKNLNDLLKSYNIDINQKNQAGDTALIISVIKGYQNIAKSLIYANAKINEKDNIGFSAFIWAALTGQENMLKLLIDAGANINDSDKDGESALMYAVKYNHKNIVELLINYGVDINQKNKYGQTALMLATKEANKDIVKLLISYGADINQKDKYGQTTLMFAKQKKNKGLIKILSNKNINKVIKFKNKK